MTDKPSPPSRMTFSEGRSFVSVDRLSGRVSIWDTNGGWSSVDPSTIDDLITALCRARDFYVDPVAYVEDGWRSVCADMILEHRDVEAVRLMGQKSKAQSEYVKALEEFFDAESAHDHDVERRVRAWKRVLELRAKRSRRRPRCT